MMAIVVQGVPIAEDVIEACLARMKGDVFKASEIQAVAERNGVTSKDGISMRVADRLIQREKKAGNLELRFPRFFVFQQVCFMLRFFPDVAH